MDIKIIVAIIGASVTLLVAIIADYSNKRKEFLQKELEFKLDRYNDFFSGFAEIGSGYKTYEAHLKFANAVNTINLIGNFEILENIYSLIDYSTNNRDDDVSTEDQDLIINKIISSIRKDLHQPYSGEFKFRIISPGIKPGDIVIRD